MTPAVTSVPAPPSVQSLEPKAMPATALNPGQYEISYDNGILSLGTSYTTPITVEKYFAVQFNVPTWLTFPISIDKIRFCVINKFDLPVKLVVYDLDGVTPLWNSSILEPRSLSTSVEWIEVNCSAIVNRDFYIALVYSTGISALTFLGVDTAPLNGHSYWGPPMQAWQEGNWMIRAVVSEASIGGSLVVDTLAVIFLPSTLFLVPIVALSAYLLLNRRKIRM